MVFVSFMFGDLEVATELVRRLAERDVPCVDANLSKIPEDALCQTIQRLLHESTHSIVVSRSDAPPSPWVAFESGFALAMHHPLFTFGAPSSLLPPFLSQWPALVDWSALDDFAEFYRVTAPQLERDVERHLKAVATLRGDQFENFRYQTWSDWLREKAKKKPSTRQML